MAFRKRRRETENAFALYYASDVHGSDQCWRSSSARDVFPR